MDATERTRLRALCEAATPGPWRTHVPAGGGGGVCCDGAGATRDGVVARTYRPSAIPDAALIAASRTAIPALLDALDAAERERVEARAETELLRGRLFDAWCACGSPGDGWDVLGMTEADYHAWVARGGGA